MKKKILVCALIAICLSIVAYGTAAFYTYEDTATNVVTAGNVRIRLEEYTLVGGKLEPFTDPIDVVPGTSVSKIVQVKNTGFAPAWVRVKLDKDLLLAPGVSGTPDLSLVNYELNRQSWAEVDGWFYYLEPLAPGATTAPIFEWVSFSSNMSNMYQQSKTMIHVTAHGVQSAHNGANVFDAAGWPIAD